MLISQISMSSQITDNYNNAALWTEFDDPRARMTFNAGRLGWNLTWNDALVNIAQSNLRCSRNLNGLISTSPNFRVAVTYRITTALQTGTTVLAITENNTQSLVTRLTNTTFNCNQNSSITINMNGNAFFIQIKPNNAVTQNNATCNPIFQQQINFNNQLNVDRRIELTQIGNRYRFRVLNPITGAELLNQVFCSPVTPSNLNFIQHGNHPWAGVNGGIIEVDDLFVDNPSTIVDPTINAFPSVTINGPTGVCELDDQPITLTAVAPGGTFVWNNPPTNGANLSVSIPGTYTVTATVNNCVSTATANIVDNCPPGCEDPCSWSKTGNNGITSANFLGTRNNIDLNFRTNKKLNLKLGSSGNLTLNEGKSLMFGKITNNTTENRWGIEEFDGGLNFWKPWPSANNGNYKLFLSDDKVGVDIGNTPTWAKSLTWNWHKFQVRGWGLSDGWATFSDERLKKNFMPIENAIEKLKLLNPYQYDYDFSDFPGDTTNIKGLNINKHPNMNGMTNRFGFKAQEVEKVLPSLVHKPLNSKGFMAMDYDGFIPITIQAIKELNAKVEKQNNAVIENEELKAKIAKMEEKFALLEKTIAQLCESGCEGLKKAGSSSDSNVLFQSIPNPTDNEALINYHLSREYRDASITVSSQDGKQLMSVKLDTKKGAGSVKINLGDLANGTYLYTLVAGERVIDTKRLQIIK